MNIGPYITLCYFNPHVIQQSNSAPKRTKIGYWEGEKNLILQCFVALQKALIQKQVYPTFGVLEFHVGWDMIRNKMSKKAPAGDNEKKFRKHYI